MHLDCENYKLNDFKRLHILEKSLENGLISIGNNYWKFIALRKSSNFIEVLHRLNLCIWLKDFYYK